jgi:N,N'-diacetyllegionaminate synthase
MHDFCIGDTSFTSPTGPYILAEIGLNHNGSLDLALEMVDKAAECGVQGVKFQSYFTEEFLHSSQKAAVEIFERCELKVEEFSKIASHCRERHVDFISTPLCFSYVKILEDLGVQAFKVASSDMTYHDLIEAITATGKPMILSTGMSSLSEIDSLMNLSFVKAYPLILLHCVSNYPPKLEDIHLRFIHSLKTLYQVPVGLSDHSIGTAIPVGAVALGASFIEKHFTLDHGLEGPDHKMSITPHDLKELVKNCQDVWNALGEWNKPVIENEVPVKSIARRGLYLKTEVGVGSELTNENALYLRPPNDIHPEVVRLNSGEAKLSQSEEGSVTRVSVQRVAIR